MLSVENHHLRSDMSFQPVQKSVYIRRRFWYAFGETGRESLNMRWYLETRPLIRKILFTTKRIKASN